MRLITYASTLGSGLGVLVPGREDAFVAVPGLEMLELIRMGQEGLGQAREADPLEDGQGALGPGGGPAAGPFLRGPAGADSRSQAQRLLPRLELR